MEKRTMNLNKFMKTGALVAMMALGVVGCNENPVDDPGTVTNVSNLEANALSSTSVGLRWSASSTAGATYMVSYRKVGASDTASSASAGAGITVSGNTAVVTGLTAGAYTFYVHTQSGTTMSTGASITWAPATRYQNDAASPATTLRMYEFASTSGSGLILDPAKGGPRNASVAQSSGDPAGSIALAIFTNTPTPAGTFDIGPAYAFVGFRNADKFDSSAYISNSGYSVNSLDELYLKQSLDTYINSGIADPGNVKAFNLPATSTDGKGVAFLMRVGHTGVGTGMHYARILVKADASGKLLRGTAPNRYVEVEISYQSVAGIPYAKGVVRNESVPSYSSKVLYPVNN
jgi:hypothetical protein